jgi:DNA polymerase-3 subunit gamma/tau
LEFTHWLTRLKIVESAAEDLAASEAERVRGKELAARLPMPELTRTWQLLLKGLGEVLSATLPLATAEMVLIRVAYASDLPTPAELISEAKSRAPSGGEAKTLPSQPAPSQPAESHHTESRPTPAVSAPTGSAQPAQAQRAEEVESSPESAPEPVSASAPENAGTSIKSFRDAVELAAERREMKLYAHLLSDVHLVHFEPGRIEIRLGKRAPTRLPNQLGEFLTDAAGTRWVVSVSDNEGEPTLKAQAEAAAAGMRQEAAEHPLVREILETFPGAQIRAVRDLGPGPENALDAPDGAEGDEDPLRDNGEPDE